MSCKLEAIECNSSQLSEQLETVEETTKSLKEQSKPNKRNQILDPVAKDRATQASDNNKNASNNSLDIARPDLNQTAVEQQEKPENEKNIVVIMDSNRKFINFNQLDGRNLQKDKVIVMPCSNIISAEKILESHQIDNPSKILLHMGINDIGNTEPENIAKDLVPVAEKFKAKYKCQVYISDITPRKDGLQDAVKEANTLIVNKLIKNAELIRVDNRNINTNHLYDIRHLKRNKNSRKSLSGVQLLSINIFQTLFQKTIQAGLLETSLNKYKNSYLCPSYQRKYSTPGPHENWKTNRFNTTVGQKCSNYNSKPHQGSQISRSTKQSNDYWKDKGKMNIRLVKR